MWFRLTCESAEGRFRALEIATDDEPARDVHLGVAITTFNRMPYVAANIARLGRLFKEQPDLPTTSRSSSSTTPRNLELSVHGAVPVEIVPNPNLGRRRWVRPRACGSIAAAARRRTCCSWTTTSPSSPR